MHKGTKTYFTEVASGLLVLLFVYTALSKLTGIKPFQGVLSQVVGTGAWAGVLSWTIPLTELAIAGLLFIPKTRTTGFLHAGILMGIFTLYIAGMLFFSDSLPCSCGGVISALSWRDHLLFNLAFTLLAFEGWRRERRRQRRQADLAL